LIRPSKSCPNNACDGMPKISNMRSPAHLREGGIDAPSP
jgi:hypothetical protein